MRCAWRRPCVTTVDELCGLIYAAALVRPERIVGLTPRSIIKKMKQKAFAAAVSREDIHAGAALLDLPLADHIANCIEALQAIVLRRIRKRLVEHPACRCHCSMNSVSVHC